MTAIVIGGGLAGLVAGYRLAQAGRRVTVLEATTRLGGMIAPVQVGGVQVDAGAEAYATRGGSGRALCEELGLEVAPPAGQPHLWWPSAGTWPMAEGVLGIPASLDDPALGSLDDDQRREVARDLELGPDVGADSATVGQLVRARMGEGALRRLVTPVAQGVYSLSPDKMPLSAFAPGLLPAMAEHGSLLAAVAAVRGRGSAAVEQPVGGMFRIVEALAGRIREMGGEVRTSAPVVALSHAGPDFAVGLPDGQKIRADRLVVATPGETAVKLLGRLAVDVVAPPVKTGRQAVLAIEHPAVSEGPVGSGLLVGESDPSVIAKALTHYSHKWPWARVGGQEIVRLSYPERYVPQRAEVIDDASRFLGVRLTDAQVSGFAAVTWDSMPGRLQAATREFVLNTVTKAGLDVVGAWIDGNGIASVIAGCERINR